MTTFSYYPEYGLTDFRQGHACISENDLVYYKKIRSIGGLYGEIKEGIKFT